MRHVMGFNADWRRFLEQYSFEDDHELYTNGDRLIPTFRVEQMVDHYFKASCKMTWHYSEDGYSAYTCSRCGRDTYPFQRSFERCPHCGAIIREVER